MDTRYFSRLAACGAYLPELKVKNSDLTQFPASAIPLIEQKTGVKERRHAASSEVTSDLGAKAAEICLRRAGVAAEALEGIILATSSPDRSMPATATRVQHLIGAGNAFAFDVNAVCSGAVYALHLADALIRSGLHDRLLVVAAELYSRILNPQDFSTYPYFGDGAGAVLLVRSTTPEGPQVLATVLGTDGAGADLIQVPAGGSMMPFSKVTDSRQQYFTMTGRAVFEFAVQKGAEVLLETMQAGKIRVDEVSHVIVHQANINIINRIAETSGIPRHKFFVNLDEIGNTAGASVLIALDGLLAKGETKAGDLILIAAFGGGLSWGCNLIRL